MKKFVALLLVLTLCLSACIFTASAEIADVEPLTVAGPDDATAKWDMWSFVDAHNEFYA